MNRSWLRVAGGWKIRCIIATVVAMVLAWAYNLLPTQGDADRNSLISLTSHLQTQHVQDPWLDLGEEIRLQPDKREPFSSFHVVRVQLPIESAYMGEAQQLFLRGFAIGWAAQCNGQFM